MSVRVERKLLRWGNGYGLRLTEDEIRQLGLRAGETIRATVDECVPHNDLESVGLLSSRRPYDVKDLLEEEGRDRARHVRPRRSR